MSEKKDNSGVAFAAREKKNPKAPDFSGPVTVNGVELRVAIWKRTSEKGELLSLVFETPKKTEAA
jgi:uncharacterized protein (DUF736 family)